MEFTLLSTDGLFLTLGAELVYTEDSSSRYLNFHWDHGKYWGCDTQRIFDFLNKNHSFTLVDRIVYLEHLHRILSSSVPERVKCGFKCNIELFELELTITHNENYLTQQLNCSNYLLSMELISCKVCHPAYHWELSCNNLAFNQKRT